jgi:protein-disulfide isomerase
MNTENKPFQLWITTALGFVGLTLSALLSQHFYDLRSGTASFSSACNISKTMNCDAIAASKYAEFVSGLPLSSFAAGWFLAIVLISLIALIPSWRKESVKALTIFSGFGLLMSGVYLLVMATVLKTYCLYCLGIDAVNLLLFILALALKPDFKSGFGWSQWKTLLGLTATSVFVVVVLLKGTQVVALDTNQVDEMVNSVLNSPVIAINADASFPSMGNPGAPVTVVEFSDFQCPYCRLGAITLNTLLNRYPGKLRVVFRNFPLDQSCNRKVEHAMHLYSCEAARVGRCAFAQGKFEAVYQKLFENQENFSKDSPTHLAEEAGVDPTELAACLKQPETALAVSKDIEEGINLNINGTPTMYVNGRKLPDTIPIPAWDALLSKL